MNRAALIGDIHGNPYALNAVLADIDRERIDMIYCLGDIFAPYPGGRQVWQILKERNIPVISGNGDSRMIDMQHNGSDEIRFFPTLYALNRLPSDIVAEIPRFHPTISIPDSDILLCHGTPSNNYDFLIYHNGELNSVVENYPEKHIIGAHCHEYRYHTRSGRQFITIGSVGIAFNGIPSAEYGILSFDADRVMLDHRSVDYDHMLLVEDMIRYGFLEDGGPISLLAFDEILSSVPRLFPFFGEFCKDLKIGNDNIYAETRRFLESINRWDDLKRYLSSDFRWN